MRKRWKRVWAAVGVAVVAYAAWSMATAFHPRVSADRAATLLGATDRRVEEAVQRMAATKQDHHLSLPPTPQPVTWEFIAGIRGMAAESAQLRGLFLSPEQQNLQTALLDDLADLRSAGLDDEDNTLLTQAEREYHDARSRVSSHSKRAMEIMTESDAMLTRGQSRNVYDDLRNLRLLFAALSDEQLLIREANEKAFADITDMQRAMWALYELHQRLVRQRAERERWVQALKAIKGG